MTDHGRAREALPASRRAARRRSGRRCRRPCARCASTKSASRLNRIILMSDGLANVGPRQPADFQRLGRELAAEGISVTTIGLGSDYNEDLMARLANASDGSHAFARTAADLTRIFNQEFDEVLSVTAQEIEILIETRGRREAAALARPRRRDHRQSRQAQGGAGLWLGGVQPAGGAGSAGRGGARRGRDRQRQASPTRPAAAASARRRSWRVKGRFSASDREVSASIDPTVMAPIIELESRERTSARSSCAIRVESRRRGRRSRRTRGSCGRARPCRAWRRPPRRKQRLDELEKSSEAAARDVGDESKWSSQRKVQRQGQSNSYSGSGGSSKF